MNTSKVDFLHLMLARAQAVIINNSQPLVQWKVNKITKKEDNVLFIFNYKDHNELLHDIHITEKMLNRAVIIGGEIWIGTSTENTYPQLRIKLFRFEQVHVVTNWEF